MNWTFEELAAMGVRLASQNSGVDLAECLREYLEEAYRKGYENAAGAPDDSAGPGNLLVALTPDGRDVVVNLDHDRTGHILFSPKQARGFADLLFKKSWQAEKVDFGSCIAKYEEFAVFAPYETHDGPIAYTVQIVERGSDDMGAIIAEFEERADAIAFASAKHIFRCEGKK